MSDESWVSDSAPYIVPAPTGQGDAWTDQAASNGRRGGQRLLEAGKAEPPQVVRDALGLARDDSAVVRRRLILLDDSPVELTDSYYPGHIAVGTPLAEARKISGGAVRLLADLGYEACDVLEDVSVHAGTDAECALLNLAPCSPVLTLMRTTKNSMGTPFEVSVMTMPPDRRLHYKLRSK